MKEPIVLVVGSRDPELLRMVMEAAARTPEHKFEIITTEPTNDMRRMNPMAALAALMATTTGDRSLSIGGELQVKVKRPALSLFNYSSTSDPRHCPARIGNAQPGWRAEGRRRKYSELARRRRRNA